MKEKNFVRSNLNNYIKVKLTDFGRMIYRNSFVKLGLPEPKIRVDEESFNEWQGYLETQHRLENQNI